MLKCLHVILCCLNSLQLVSELAWMTFELQFWVFFFLVSRFLVMEAIFFGGLLFVWRLFLVFKLDWGWRLVENIVWSKTHYYYYYFYGFWSSFDEISKIRAYFGSSYYAFSCAFLGLDWRIAIWGWKSKCFSRKMHKIVGEIFFFFSRTRACSAGGEDEQTPYWRHHDIIKKKNKFFFWLPWYSWIDYAYVRIIMRLLNLTLLEQLVLLLFLWYNFYLIPIMLSNVIFVKYLNLLWQ